MTKAKTLWLLVGLVCLALWLGYVFTQGEGWEALNDTGSVAYQRGDYAEAEKQWGAALKAAEGFGSEDPRLATSLNNLALLYEAQGKYVEAEPLYKRALAIDEKTLVPEHPDLAASLNNLAALYHAQGRYTEAEPLYKRSLAIYENYEKVLGPKHPRVVTSLENYAALLRETGRGKEATDLEARAQMIRAKHGEQKPAK
jgi:tetratricopeptide (TPR) repeat protein